MKRRATHLWAAAVSMATVAAIWAPQTAAEDWFGPAITTSLPFAAGGQGIACGDLNGDGIDDVVVTDGEVFDIHTYFALGDGHFQSGETRVVGSGIATLGDTDGDGAIEVITSSDHTLMLFEVSAGGQLPTVPATVQIQSLGSHVDSLCDDLDGDGYEDVVVVGYQGLTVVWGSPTGPISPGQYYEVPVGECREALGVDCVDAGDMTGDGLIDIVIAASWGNIESCPPSKAALRLLRRTGPRLFQFDGQWFGWLSVANDSPEYHDVEVSDIDGDGKRDVAANRSADGVRMFRGFGTGLFSGVEVDLENDGWYLTLFDVDQDGKTDLATGLAHSAVHAGLGGFAFLETQYFAGQGALWITHGRFTADQREDLIGIDPQDGIAVFPRLEGTASIAGEPRSTLGTIRAEPSTVVTGTPICKFTGSAVGGGVFELFSVDGREILRLPGVQTGEGGTVANWDLAIHGRRAAPGVYLIRLGEGGPTGRVTVIR